MLKLFEAYLVRLKNPYSFSSGTALDLKIEGAPHQQVCNLQNGQAV